MSQIRVTHIQPECVINSVVIGNSYGMPTIPSLLVHAPIWCRVGRRTFPIIVVCRLVTIRVVITSILHPLAPLSLPLSPFPVFETKEGRGTRLDSRCCCSGTLTRRVGCACHSYSPGLWLGMLGECEGRAGERYTWLFVPELVVV